MLSHFFFNEPATTEIYTLSLHDALPISLFRAEPRAAADKNLSQAISKWLGLCRQFTHLEKLDRKSTRLNSSHVAISYAVFCLKKKKKTRTDHAKSRVRKCLCHTSGNVLT